jgi:hypothetical protein
MAYTYLFFKPSRLPLTVQDLSEETTLLLNDVEAIREALARAVAEIEWVDQRVGPPMGKAETDGRWLKFLLPADDRGTLSLRCSLRADYRAFVQGLCDKLGWLAFDERAMCYQPHREPFHAG